MSQDKKNMKLPEDYFKGLGDQIEGRIEALEDEIEKNAPLLYKVGKDERYKLPEDYFKTFAERQKNLKPARSILRLWRPAIGIAASGILLFAWFMNQETNSGNDLNDEEMFAFLVDNVEILDE